jgi:hypothetical protein
VESNFYISDFMIKRMSELFIPRANWPQTREPVRVVQLILGDRVHGDLYLIFEDIRRGEFDHDEILAMNLKRLNVPHDLQTSFARGCYDYCIAARTGERYFCPGMGFAEVLRPHIINFFGHSKHYSLGIDVGHLQRIAFLESEITFLYKETPLNGL